LAAANAYNVVVRPFCNLQSFPEQDLHFAALDTFEHILFTLWLGLVLPFSGFALKLHVPKDTIAIGLYEGTLVQRSNCSDDLLSCHFILYQFGLVRQHPSFRHLLLLLPLHTMAILTGNFSFFGAVHLPNLQFDL